MTNTALLTALVVPRHLSQFDHEAVRSQIKSIAPKCNILIGQEIFPGNGPVPDVFQVDGILVVALRIESPVSPEFFEVGPFPHLYLRDPAETCRQHTAHIRVFSPDEPNARAEAVAKTRAITLVARAIAKLMPTLAIGWPDAKQFVPLELIDEDLDALVPIGGVAPSLCVRMLITGANIPDALVVGTQGLAAYGHPEIELAPSEKEPEELIAIARVFVRYILTQDSDLMVGDTFTIGSDFKFSISQSISPSFFSDSITLTPIE